MGKSNKELAVELYVGFLNFSGGLFSNPNFKGTVNTPSYEEMVSTVKELTELLKSIED